MFHENNSLEKIKNTLRVFAQQHHVPCISSATEAYLLQHLMKYKPKNCLEIWSAIWYSTHIIGNTIKSWWWRLVSFEISHPSYMMAIYHFHQAHNFNTRLYHLNILDIDLGKLITPETIDFVFIDGAKQEYADYLEKVLPYCAPHATLICDDVIKFHDKVKPLYEIIKKNHLTYRIIQLEEDDGIGVIVKG